MTNDPVHSFSWGWVRAGRPTLALPLVCDSPHSGTCYPGDFGHALPLDQLRSSEDTHVERLWGHAPDVGATLIAARFARTYIDVNRALEDLDPRMLADSWPEPVSPSPRTLELGMGLVWRRVPSGAPIYARRLPAAEVRQRIERCWRPYHAALLEARDRALREFGCCWHLDLHSMPSNAYERLGLVSSTPLADFVLGDRHGRSCEPEFVALVKHALEAHGHRVAVNDPYEGQELVRLMGDPQRHCHSLQIEVNRALYMNERTREPNAHFDDLRHDLSNVLEEVARHVRLRSRGLRAH
jgi:N-formylglutamate deformylase